MLKRIEDLKALLNKPRNLAVAKHGKKEKEILPDLPPLDEVVHETEDMDSVSLITYPYAIHDEVNFSDDRKKNDQG